MKRSMGDVSPGVLARKSVPLTPADLSDLERLRDGASPLGRSLAALAGESVRGSDAAVLHGLLTLGLQRVREAAEEAGYAALAETYRTDVDESAARSAARSHRARGARARADDE